MFGVVLSIIILTSFFIVMQTNSSCPDAYKKLSPQHTFCLKINPTCRIYKNGIRSKDRKQILKIHNEYRSKIALGKEHKAGRLPQASNMRQMVWDDELAAVAQKWARNCKFEHDCSECRSVQNFSVGQNLGMADWKCGDWKCMRKMKRKAFKPDWSRILNNFYKEINYFSKKYVTKMPSLTGKVFGHFTQIIWAETWKIGCGYSVFKNGRSYRQLYVCNYGPKGNIVEKTIYEKGNPCSKCPKNSCCGKSCRKPHYDGICNVH